MPDNLKGRLWQESIFSILRKKGKQDEKRNEKKGLIEDQLDGKIELNRTGGTEFKITFEREK